jgi:hypothetical protein
MVVGIRDGHLIEPGGHGCGGNRERLHFWIEIGLLNP